ncbi:MAG: AraC family transcriptional regulator [Hespellia sp.]|nr:AraC family transcriptional regulator [Hespellia sp.]
MNQFTFQGNMEDSNRILYTPSSFAKKNLLHLQEIGSLQATSAHTSRRENLSSYLFFLVESGSGTLEYNDITYPVNSGDVVFIDCQKSYAHSTYEDLWKLRWVHFNGPNMDEIYKKYKERSGTPLFHPYDLIHYETLLTTMEDIALSSSHIKDMSICEKLTGLLTAVMNDSWHSESHSNIYSKRQSLQQIKEYINNNYEKTITLDQLADMYYINKFYLSRIFKEEHGVTIHNYIQQLRITHAKRLLRFSDMNINEIATVCGLNDANYFSRVFKKVEGISPGEFRKIW